MEGLEILRLPGEGKNGSCWKRSRERLSVEVVGSSQACGWRVSVAVGLHIAGNRLLCDLSLSHLVSGCFGSTVCLESKAWLLSFIGCGDPYALKNLRLTGAVSMVMI